jgi:Zn-dependent protease with chaperone function
MHMLLRGDNRLQGIVTAAAEGMNLQVPKTFLLDVPMANAMALPVTRELIFTSRLMEISSDDEVSSICTHELAHLTESKRVVFLRVIGSLVWFPILFIRPLLHAYGPAGLLVLLVSLAARALFRMLSRRMERRADNMATEQQGDSGVYARALEKLYRDNQIPAVNASRHKTHPHLYDRLLAAGIQPDFERPKPPATLSAVYFPLWLGLGMLIGWALASSS